MLTSVCVIQGQVIQCLHQESRRMKIGKVVVLFAATQPPTPLRYLLSKFTEIIENLLPFRMN